MSGFSADYTTWPTADEQEAVHREGCTCRLLTLDTEMGPGEWEQDAYCGEHGDRRIMRATIRKLNLQRDRISEFRDALQGCIAYLGEAALPDDDEAQAAYKYGAALLLNEDSQ